MLQACLNLTNIFSLPSFLYKPSRASYIQCRLTKGFLSIGANVFRCCAALIFKKLYLQPGMDLKEEDLLIILVSMSRKYWWAFTTFKTRLCDLYSLQVKYVYSAYILLFLRNILQNISKNYETIARFSLLCTYRKFSLLNLHNLRRIIATCCDKFSLHSQSCS